MLKIKYCEECANKRKWPTTGNTAFARCGICGNRIECFSEESTRLPSPIENSDLEKTVVGQAKEPVSQEKDFSSRKKPVIEKIKGPLQVDGAAVKELTLTSASIKRGRKPARLTAEKARKLLEEKRAKTVDIEIDTLLKKILAEIVSGEVVVPLKGALGHDAVLTAVQKTLIDLGYEVVLAEDQIRIKW